MFSEKPNNDLATFIVIYVQKKDLIYVVNKFLL